MLIALECLDKSGEDFFGFWMLTRSASKSIKYGPPNDNDGDDLVLIFG